MTLKPGAGLALVMFSFSAVESARAGGDFNLSADPLQVALCAGGPSAEIGIEVQGISGFNEDVTLSLPGLPFGFTSEFVPNPVPTGPFGVLSLLTLGSVISAPLGETVVTIEGNSLSAGPHQIQIDAFVANTPPTGTPKPLLPLEGQVGEPALPDFQWLPIANASHYRIQISERADFSVLAVDEIVFGTQFTSATPLAMETTWFWRVRAENGCGEGVWIGPLSFTTGLLICSAVNAAIPDGNPTGLIADFTPQSDLRYFGVEVDAAATHSFVGDLVFRLSHPGTGTQRLLLDRPGVPASTFGCSGDDVDATFADAASLPAEDQCALTPPAIAGVLLPSQSLAALDGLRGPMRFTALDAVPGDSGQLGTVCISATVESDLIFLNGF